jgi:hypothetical protein
MVAVEMQLACWPFSSDLVASSSNQTVAADYKCAHVYVISICEFMWNEQLEMPKLLHTQWLIW